MHVWAALTGSSGLSKKKKRHRVGRGYNGEVYGEQEENAIAYDHILFYAPIKFLEIRKILEDMILERRCGGLAEMAPWSQT